jgi:aryl-alcohol dehydrogenase-like predicted oxidoreductase
MGYGDVDPGEAAAGLDMALEMASPEVPRLIDVAAVYGCGESERLVGQALRGRRERGVLVSKCGYAFDEAKREVLGPALDEASLRAGCEASLRRLGVDVIDVYALHPFQVSVEDALRVRDVFEALADEGKIRGYGWCIEDPAKLRAFAAGQARCWVSPQLLNWQREEPELIALAEGLGLGILPRRPLGMGLFTGALDGASELAENDMRRRFGWDLCDGKQAAQLRRMREASAILTRRGHSLAQAALGWLLARSPVAIPIPGFETRAHMEENLRAGDLGPLGSDQLAELRED